MAEIWKTNEAQALRTGALVVRARVQVAVVVVVILDCIALEHTGMASLGVWPSKTSQSRYDTGFVDILLPSCTGMLISTSGGPVSSGEEWS